jgi:hypothetical protein
VTRPAIEDPFGIEIERHHQSIAYIIGAIEKEIACEASKSIEEGQSTDPPSDKNQRAEE